MRATGSPSFVAGLAMLALALAACTDGNTAAPPPEPARPVKVATVAFRAAESALRLPGTTVARTETTIAFRVGGKMVARLVEVGDRVAPGQVIARLDPQDLRLAADAARSRLREAEADHAQARLDLDRIERLQGGQAFTRATYDQRRTAVQTTRARLEEARSNLRSAENQFAYTEVKADTAGVVTATLAEPGQVVAQGQGIIRLALDGEREVLVGIPENRIALLRSVPTATVTLWADAEQRFDARLRELSPVADSATRTYAARFALTGASAQLPLGLTGTLTLAAAGSAPLAVLPGAALFHEAGKPAVWVVDTATGGLSLRPVTVAGFRTEEVLIAEGLRDGETVVAAGAHKLSADSRVRVWQ
ncbi:MAG: efflux RND transporter periplasmic adaptor subunit [Thalassobaculales bacterium]